MDNDVSHLPKDKQQQLKDLVSLITKKALVEKIVLFGSHARGDWVSDKYSEGHVTYAYESDFDLLVIVKDEKLEKDHALWGALEKEIAKTFDTPVNLLTDSINMVNSKIQEGNYFYLDVLKDGIILYDSGNFEFVTPKFLTPQVRRDNATKDFNFWISKADSFVKDYRHNIDDESLNNAAFHLSQVAEALYFCVLLVFTGYKPKSHKLDKIAELAEDLAPSLKGIFPTDTPEQRHMFDVLKAAYIDARYKQDYLVKTDELDFLERRLHVLRKEVEKVCQDKITSF